MAKATGTLPKEPMSLPRPANRKVRGGDDFYWSGGPKPRTDRGQRRHARRDELRKHHAQQVWAGGTRKESA